MMLPTNPHLLQEQLTLSHPHAAEPHSGQCEGPSLSKGDDILWPHEAHSYRLESVSQLRVWQDGHLFGDSIALTHLWEQLLQMWRCRS